MTDAGATAREEWRTGWPVVFSGFIGFMAFSTMIAAMSAFMGPLAKEFGWSRTVISIGTGAPSIIIALASPFYGILLDKYGPRRLVLPGIILSGLAVVAMAFNTGSAILWYGIWIFYALAALFVNTPNWTMAIAGLFTRAQGMALAITLAGATAAHATIPVLSVFLIDALGWRMAFVALGAGFGGLAFVVCYFLFHGAQDRTRLAQRGKPGEADAPAQPAATGEQPGLTLAEAWRSRALWQIGISILIIMLLTIGFLVHQIEILIETGVSREMAAGLAGLAGAMGIVGKLVTGFLIDRYPGNWVGGLTMSTAAIAFALLLRDSPTTAIIVMAMLVNGYTAGAKLHIASYLTVQYAGLRNFGKIYGVISSLVSVGSGIGPIVAGMIYDATGSYSTFLLAGAAALAFSSLLLLTLPRYPAWSAHGRSEPAAA
ncbi:MAG: MFS transporter [Sphingomonadaceae bacterium]